MRAQLLIPSVSATSAADVVRRLVGVQAQDSRAARLGIRVRSKGLTATEVERERVEDRSFVRTWAMRGTIHLVVGEDVTWLNDLFGDLPINESYRRLAYFGVPREQADRALRLLRRMLANGPMTRAEVGERLKRRGIAAIRGAQDQTTSLVRFATVKGLTVLGPEVDGQETLVLADDWLAGIRQAAPKDPPAELARRYVLGHGPASFEDFEWWSGLRRSAARRGWQAVADTKPRGGAGRATSTLRLLPMFDAMFLGYRDRSTLGSPAVLRKISAGAGIIHPFAITQDGAVARWKLERRRGGAEVKVNPFGEPVDERALAREVKDLGRFLEADVSLGIDVSGR